MHFDAYTLFITDSESYPETLLRIFRKIITLLLYQKKRKQTGRKKGCLRSRDGIVGGAKFPYSSATGGVNRYN